MDSRPDATEILLAAAREPRKAADVLLPLVYEDLRERASNMMKRERPDHTLQATGLVHEAFFRMIDQTRVDWQGRTHFLAVAATAMRRVLLDHARARGREKRLGGRVRVTLSDADALPGSEPVDLIALDEALAKLETLDPRQARIVELRFFGEMTVDQIAGVVGVSPRTVDAEWAHAKAWLKRELGPGDGPGGEGSGGAAANP